MNKNKLILAIVAGLLLLLMVFIAITLKGASKTATTGKTTGDFTIWILGGNNEKANTIVQNFKSINTAYKNVNIVIESFASYDDYYYSLISAIIAGKTPDVFVLNNNEKNSIFGNQVIGMDSNIISPNNFRKKFKGVFSDDLILNSGEGEDSKEFIAGIPVGYESLGIFYNRRYVKNSELSSLSGLNNVVAKLKKKKPNLIPIGIGNGSTVLYAADIITQFFMLEKDVSGLKNLSGTKIKQGLASYLLYGDVEGYNGYDSRFMELSNLGKNSIDLFSQGETFMVIGYPRLINEIAEKGFSKNFLLASPFPHYFSGEGKTLINYDYFVINKDTINYTMASDFLGYLASDIGAQNYLDNFQYYLPALLSLESDQLEEKINDDYNIILKDFYNSEYELSSFDKGIKSIYDNKIISILDNSANYESAFAKFKRIILCKTTKIATLENLSKSCD